MGFSELNSDYKNNNKKIIEILYHIFDFYIRNIEEHISIHAYKKLKF